MLHILPVDDDREHEESTVCWCGPRVEWSNRDTGAAYSEGLVIHRASDGRELFEPDSIIEEPTDAE